MSRPQFSIRTLLWLTLVVAVMLAPVAAIYRYWDGLIRDSYRQAFERLEGAEKRELLDKSAQSSLQSPATHE